MNRRHLIGLPAALLTGGLALASGVAYAVVGDPFSEAAPTTADVLQEAQMSSPQEQQPAFADGAVSRDELEAAVQRTVTCLQERGITPEVRPAKGKRPTEIGLAGPTIEDIDRQRVVLDECQAIHMNGIDNVWKAQNRPTAAETAQSWAFVGACMAEGGVAVPSRELTLDDLLGWLNPRDPAVHFQSNICWDRAYDEFGFWP